MEVYRLLLSFAVALSHMGLSIYGYNPGEIAVVSFLLLSGYVMTALINKYYYDFDKVIPFYFDRAIRLMPQFVFYSILSFLVVKFSNYRHPWISEAPSLSNTLLQLSMLPLNFFNKFPNMLLPQAWSLGLELMFYMIIPFVLLWCVRLQTAVVSFFVFLVAYAGYINSNWFAYRLIPGTFLYLCWAVGFASVIRITGITIWWYFYLFRFYSYLLAFRHPRLIV